MSVRTTADEHRDAAKENINDAIENISAIVVARVWGWDEYTAEYLVKLQSILNDLLNIRADL